MLQLHGAIASHVGNVRETNQDRAHFGGYVAVVADGMGGHQGGETAATIAINEFLEVMDPIAPGGLVELVEDANRAVFERAADPDLRGMGTTLVALTLRPNEEKVNVVNVGDSRAYLLRGDELGQLTLDHSLVEDLVRQNRLTPAEALIHPQRNILTRALGISSEVEVDRFLMPTEIGDRFLLCSDGLFNEVTEPEMARILAENTDPHEAAEVLVDAALAGAGRDNVTVAVVDVIEDEAEASSTSAKTVQVPVVDPAEAETSLSPAASVAPSITSAPASAVVTAEAPVVTVGAVGVGLAEPEEYDREPSSTFSEAVETHDIPLSTSRTSRLAPALFIIGLIALLAAGGYYSAELWAKRTWFVAPAAEGTGTLAVFNGRPDGFLWVDAGPGEEIEVDLQQLTQEAKLELDMGRTFDTRADAVQYVVDNTIPAAPAESSDSEAATDDGQPVEPDVLNDLEEQVDDDPANEGSVPADDGT